jgi:hypothetical protein
MEKIIFQIELFTKNLFFDDFFVKQFIFFRVIIITYFCILFYLLNYSEKY